MLMMSILIQLYVNLNLYLVLVHVLLNPSIEHPNSVPYFILLTSPIILYYFLYFYHLILSIINYIKLKFYFNHSHRQSISCEFMSFMSFLSMPLFFYHHLLKWISKPISFFCFLKGWFTLHYGHMKSWWGN